MGPILLVDEVFQPFENVTDLTSTARLPPFFFGVLAVIPLVPGHDVVLEVQELGDVCLADSVVVLVIKEADDLDVATFLPVVVSAYLFQQSKCITPPLFGEKVEAGVHKFLRTAWQAFVHVSVFLVNRH